jgi:antitoxin component of RelBE/YafQ-DinJ toxin-antitoxin module
MSHNANMLAAKADTQLMSRCQKAARTVGMKISDIVRIGSLRVVEEIEATGSVTIVTNSPKARKKGGKR